MDGSSTPGFGLAPADDVKKDVPKAPQASDYLNDPDDEKAQTEKSQKTVVIDPSSPNQENQQAGQKVKPEEIESWMQEEKVKNRKQNYLKERVKISISKYLGDETLNEYVKRINDVDRTGAENEAKIWTRELEEQIEPLFVGVHSAFSRDAVADAVEGYFRDNVPIVAQIIAEIRIRDKARMQSAPREIYLDFLRKFLRAYFNSELLAAFASVKELSSSEASNILSPLERDLEEEFMKQFDSVKFNSFDEEAVFKKTEEAVLEELKK